MPCGVEGRVRFNPPYMVLKTSDGLVHVTALSMENVGLRRVTFCGALTWDPLETSQQGQRLPDTGEVTCLGCLAHYSKYS